MVKSLEINMDFEKIYNEVLAMYPVKIDISDGKLIEEIGGFLSQNFSKIYEQVDYNATLKGEWHSLMAWVIFQVLHEEAQKLFLKNIFQIGKSVDRKLVRKFLVTNLEQEGYREMKGQFLDFERNHGLFGNERGG